MQKNAVLAYQWQRFMFIKKVFYFIGLRLAASDRIFGSRLKLGLSGVKCVSAENCEFYRESRSRLQGSV